jgi:hypothetical protein
VTCDTGKVCNPATKACDTPNCQWRIQNMDCTGSQLCIGPKNASGKVTSGFCSPVLPRTIVFDFGKATLPATNNGSPWRTDGTNPVLEVGVQVNKVTAHVSDPAMAGLAHDFTNDPSATFSLKLAEGDHVTVGVFDHSPDGDRLLNYCEFKSDDEFAQYVRSAGLGCGDPDSSGFFVEMHPQ